AVDVAFNGEDGLFMAQTNSYDLIVLDLMLPVMDGFSLLKQLRRSGKHTPVLVLTARDEREWVVKLLNVGADDFVTKPFDLGELIARAKALIRRGSGHGDAILRVGPIAVNTVTHQVLCGDQPLELTAMEYRVLEYLAHHVGAVVSKSELLEHLYD